MSPQMQQGPPPIDAQGDPSAMDTGQAQQPPTGLLASLLQSQGAPSPMDSVMEAIQNGMRDLNAPKPITPSVTSPDTSKLDPHIQRLRDLISKGDDYLKQSQPDFDQAHQLLQHALGTNGLQEYLPKPNARQMLSDVMTNFGLAQLTGNQFVPIQQQRFKQALEQHTADVQNRTQAFSALKDQRNFTNQMLTQQRQTLYDAEKSQNDQLKLEQQAAETARKQATSQAQLDLKRAIEEVDKLPTAATVQQRNLAMTRLAVARENFISKVGNGNPVAAYMEHSVANNGGEFDWDAITRAAGLLKERSTSPFIWNGMQAPKYFPTQDNGLRMVGADKAGNIHYDMQLQDPAGFGHMSEAAKQNLTRLSDVVHHAQMLRDMMEQASPNGTPYSKLDNGPIGAGQGQGFMDWMAKTANDAPFGNQLLSSAVAHGRGFAYSHGIRPNDPVVAEMMNLASLLTAEGTKPYQTSRNMENIRQIQQHMPDLTKDSWSNAYGKLNTMLKLLEPVYNDFNTTERQGINAPNPFKGGRDTPLPPSKPPVKAPPASKGGKGTVLTDPADVGKFLNGDK